MRSLPPIPGAVVCTSPTVIGSGPEAIGVGRGGEDHAAVAQDHVRARAAGDGVVALAADHDRLAGADGDHVVAAVGRIGRDDRVDVAGVGVGAVERVLRVQAGPDVRRVELACRPT